MIQSMYILYLSPRSTYPSKETPKKGMCIVLRILYLYCNVLYYVFCICIVLRILYYIFVVRRPNFRARPCLMEAPILVLQ